MTGKEDLDSELEGGLKVIRADGADVDKVWGVVKSCSDWLLSERGLDHWLKYYTREIIEKKIKTQEVLLVYQDGEVVGTITLDANPVDYYTEENLAHFSDPSAKTLYVSTVAVNPDVQGRGIASRLMKLADDIARSLRDGGRGRRSAYRDS